jgi:hypothetical protein
MIIKHLRCGNRLANCIGEEDKKKEKGCGSTATGAGAPNPIPNLTRVSPESAKHDKAGGRIKKRGGACEALPRNNWRN